MAANSGWFSSSLQPGRGCQLRCVLSLPLRCVGAAAAAHAPCDACQADQHALEEWSNHLVGGLGQLCCCQRYLHLLHTRQQLIILKDWKAVLRHAGRLWWVSNCSTRGLAHRRGAAAAAVLCTGVGTFKLLLTAAGLWQRTGRCVEWLRGIQGIEEDDWGFDGSSTRLVVSSARFEGKTDETS